MLYANCYFSDRVTEVSQDSFVIPIQHQNKGLCPGVKLDLYFPGFPTLKHLKHKAKFYTVFIAILKREYGIINVTHSLPDGLCCSVAFYALEKYCNNIASSVSKLHIFCLSIIFAVLKSLH